MIIYLAAAEGEKEAEKGNNFLFSFYDIYYSTLPFLKKNIFNFN